MARRFELVEGTSNKFWEIVLEGDSYTVRFGRIGTNGQTQIKSFGDANKAKHAYEKVVAEKIAKGYVEKSGEGDEPAAVATLPSPKVTKPIEPAPIAKGALRVAWTDELRMRCAPRRGDPVPRRRRIDLAKHLAQARSNFDRNIGAWRNGVEVREGTVGRTWVERVLADFGPGTKSEGAFDAQLEAAKYAVAWSSLNVQWNRDIADDLAEASLDEWIARGGISGAIECAALLVRTTFRHLQMSGKYAIFLEVGDDPHDTGSGWFNHPGDSALLSAVRRVLSTFSDEDWNAARARFEALRPKLDAREQTAAAFLFDDEAWANEALAAWEASGAIGNEAAPLLAVIRDQKTLEKIDAASANVHEWARFFPSVLRSIDVAAFPMLVARVQKAEKRLVAPSIAYFEGPEATALYVELLGEKNLRTLASKHLQDDPEHAMVALEKAARGRSGVADFARSLLESIRRSNAVATDEPIVEAPLESLPSVLRDPPWRKKGAPKRAAIVSSTKDPDPLGDRIDDDELQVRARQWVGSMKQPPNEPMIRLLERALEGREKPNFWNLLQVGDRDRAMEFLNTIPASAWSYPPDPWQVHVLVAMFGLPGLPPITRILARFPDRLEGALHVASTSLAMVAAAGLEKKGSRPNAQRWMLRHPEHAIAGLLPVALGEPGVERGRAERALRWLARNGREDGIRARAKLFGREVEDAVDALLSFDPLLDFPPKIPKMPDWFKPETLPRPKLLDGHALPISAIESLGAMLAFSSVDLPYAGIAQVKEACDEASLDAFAQATCESWVAAGSPSASEWGCRALGLLGTDASARYLGTRLFGWLADGSKARVQLGLDALAQIGSDVALMHIGKMERGGRAQWVKDRATAKLEQVAEARGLTRDELEDRTVPDLGLDANGSRELDFGSRKFFVRFDEHLKPSLVDEGGNRLDAMPRASKNDDAEKARDASATWKTLREDLEKIATHQIARMEKILCTRRRLDRDSFEKLVVGHPLTVHLARRLVFAIYGAENTIVRTFRVAEDRSYADERDEPTTLTDVSDDARIGIVHPLELTDEQRRAWGQIFADYEILQPFAQLGRPVFTPTEDEKRSDRLARFGAKNVGNGRIWALRTRGFRVDGDESIHGFFRELGNGVRVHFDVDPSLESSSREKTVHEISALRIWRGGQTATFGDLDPVDFSELLLDGASLLG